MKARLLSEYDYIKVENGGFGKCAATAAIGTIVRVVSGPDPVNSHCTVEVEPGSPHIQVSAGDLDELEATTVWVLEIHVYFRYPTKSETCVFSSREKAKRYFEDVVLTFIREEDAVISEYGPNDSCWAGTKRDYSKYNPKCERELIQGFLTSYSVDANA
jgi:hypothetical protein